MIKEKIGFYIIEPVTLDFTILDTSETRVNSTAIMFDFNSSLGDKPRPFETKWNNSGFLDVKKLEKNIERILKG